MGEREESEGIYRKMHLCGLSLAVQDREVVSQILSHLNPEVKNSLKRNNL